MRMNTLLRKGVVFGLFLLLIGTSGIASTMKIQSIEPQTQEKNLVWLGDQVDTQENTQHQPLTRQDWITYGGENANSVGVVGGYEPWEGAIRLTPTELASYDGWRIVSVRYYHGYQYMSYPDPESHGNMKIYGAGSATDPGAVLDSEPFWTPEGNAWFQFNLSHPVTINASQDYWFSVEILNQTAGDYPLGVDAGPAIDGKGDFCEMGEGNWQELQIYGLDWNWNHMVGLEPANVLPPPNVHGPTDGWTHVSYTFWTDPVATPYEDQFYVKWDWGDGTITDWLGPYASGMSASSSYEWSHPGIYGVRAKLACNGSESDWSAPHMITINTSGPPLEPLLSGPSVGQVGVTYNFTVVLTDPDGDEFFFQWNWGDGNSSDWLGPYDSGQPVTTSHAWNKPGTYPIRVNVKDPFGAEFHSDPFYIQIVKLRPSFILGSLTNRSETKDLLILRTSFLLIIPSHGLLYVGESIAIGKQYLGFLRPFMFGGVFQAALLANNL